MKKDNKKTIMLFILFLIFIISVGYAYLSSSLSITGSTAVSGNTWDIHFANVDETDESVTASTPANIDPNDNTKISFSVTLEKPGDGYAFSADIVNAGIIDGMIDELNVTINNQPIASLPSCLHFEMRYIEGDSVLEKQLIHAGASETIMVIFYYDSDIDSDDLITDTEVFNISIDLTFVQGDSSAFDRRATYYLYSNSGLADSEGRVLSIVNPYESYEELLSNSPHDFFVRYTVDNIGVIKEISIGYEINGNVYFLKGSDYVEEDQYESLYNEQKSILLNSFGESSCIEYNSSERSISCSNEYIVVKVVFAGNVSARNGVLLCEISGQCGLPMT